MDVIKRMAMDFSRSLSTIGRTLEKFDGELNSLMLYINKDTEKLRFLAYLGLPQKSTEFIRDSMCNGLNRVQRLFRG